MTTAPAALQTLRARWQRALARRAAGAAACDAAGTAFLVITLLEVAARSVVTLPHVRTLEAATLAVAAAAAALLAWRRRPADDAWLSALAADGHPADLFRTAILDTPTSSRLFPIVLATAAREAALITVRPATLRSHRAPQRRAAVALVLVSLVALLPGLRASAALPRETTTLLAAELRSALAAGASTPADMCALLDALERGAVAPADLAATQHTVDTAAAAQFSARDAIAAALARSPELAATARALQSADPAAAPSAARDAGNALASASPAARSLAAEALRAAAAAARAAGDLTTAAQLDAAAASASAGTGTGAGASSATDPSADAAGASLAAAALRLIRAAAAWQDVRLTTDAALASTGTIPRAVDTSPLPPDSARSPRSRATPPGSTSPTGIPLPGATRGADISADDIIVRRYFASASGG